MFLGMDPRVSVLICLWMALQIILFQMSQVTRMQAIHFLLSEMMLQLISCDWLSRVTESEEYVRFPGENLQYMMTRFKKYDRTEILTCTFWKTNSTVYSNSHTNRILRTSAASSQYFSICRTAPLCSWLHWISCGSYVLMMQWSQQEPPHVSLHMPFCLLCFLYWNQRNITRKANLIMACPCWKIILSMMLQTLTSSWTC